MACGALAALRSASKFGRAATIVAIATLAACGEVASVMGLGACSEATRALGKEPAADAARAVARGDLHYRAVAGYGISTPGVNRATAMKNGYLVLKQTSDRPADASCSDYQAAAMVYAEAYNRRVLELTDSPPPRRR